MALNIPPLSPSGISPFGSLGTQPKAAPSSSFADAVQSAVHQVNNLQANAEQKVTSLLSGNGQDVHSATLAVEQSSLAFDLMLQVRNKVVNAYQEISRLQF